MHYIEKIISILYSELFCWLITSEKKAELLRVRPEIIAALDIDYGDL